jgi:hypothetical protein
LQKIQTKVTLPLTKAVLFVTLMNPDRLNMLTIKKDPVTIRAPREQTTQINDWSPE